MTGQILTFKKEGPIGIITLNRPAEKNTITAETAAELKAVRSEIGFGSEINVLILTGEGDDFFSAGTGDLEYSKFNGREEFVSKLAVASTMGSFDRPTIAAINGDAFGQGLELALACDIRIASETARFSMPQAARGEMAFDGGTQRLPRLVGKGRALELILGGGNIKAQEAFRIGLVNKVVPVGSVVREAKRWAKVLSMWGAVAMSAIGIRYSIALGIVAGILEIIPGFGPTIAAIPAILLALFQGASYIDRKSVV